MGTWESPVVLAVGDPSQPIGYGPYGLQSPGGAAYDPKHQVHHNPTVLMEFPQECMLGEEEAIQKEQSKWSPAVSSGGASAVSSPVTTHNTTRIINRIAYALRFK